MWCSSRLHSTSLLDRSLVETGLQSSEPWGTRCCCVNSWLQRYLLCGPRLLHVAIACCLGLLRAQALSKNGEYLGDRYVRLLHVPKQEMEEQVRLGTLAIPGAQAKMRQKMMRNSGAVEAMPGSRGPYGGGDPLQHGVLQGGQQLVPELGGAGPVGAYPHAPLPGLGMPHSMGQPGMAHHLQPGMNLAMGPGMGGPNAGPHPSMVGSEQHVPLQMGNPQAG